MGNLFDKNWEVLVGMDGHDQWNARPIALLGFAQGINSSKCLRVSEKDFYDLFANYKTVDKSNHKKLCDV